MANFDFGEYINDENRFEELVLSEEQEDHLSPYGVFCAKLGRPRAKRLFDTLRRIAQRISAEQGGRPAILLDEEGGEFVSILVAQE